MHLEQVRPGIAKSRQAWSSQKLDCESLIFIDETWAKTNMARTHGRSGQRLHIGLPHGHCKTTTLVAGIKTTGLTAPMVLDGPLNGDWFEAYVRHIPELKTGNVVIMENLPGHKHPCIKKLMEDAGVTLIFLPACSPDPNPVEKTFSKLKALLRKAKERTVDGLWKLIGKLVDAITPDECRNYFKSCGYEL